MDDLGMLASETAWDALLASLPPLPVKTPSTNVALSSLALDAMLGHYAFSPDAIAEIRRKRSALEIELTGHANSSNYLSTGTLLCSPPWRRTNSKLPGREDRLHIERDAHGVIIGITINPEPWPVHATRK